MKSHPAKPEFDKATKMLLDGKSEEAEKAYRAILKKWPNHALSLHNLGTILFDRDLDAALPYVEKALKIKPDFSHAWNTAGAIYDHKGDKERAIKYFNKAIECDAKYTPPYRHVAGVMKVKSAEDPAFKKIHDLLKDDSLGNSQRMDLYYALGKMYQKCQEDDQTFRYFKKGNDIRWEMNPFNMKRSYALFENIKKYFTKEALRKRVSYMALANQNREDIHEERPIFIVGMPRSGSTLTEQILLSHPAVETIGESTILTKMVDRYMHFSPSTSAKESVLKVLNPPKSNIRLAALNYQQNTLCALRVVNKMLYNFIHLGVISMMFPYAKVIHTKRCALDSCVSMYFQHFRSKNEYTNNLTALGQYYQLYEEMIAHWHEVFNDDDIPFSIMDIQYEDLVTKPEENIRKIINYAGLPWHKDCLRFNEGERTVRTASNWQVRKPIYTSSVKKWKRYEKYLGELLKILPAKQYGK